MLLNWKNKNKKKERKKGKTKAEAFVPGDIGDKAAAAAE